MFCDGCGGAVQSGQAFCSTCGKQIVGPVLPIRVNSRVQQNVHLLGILWLAMSAFNAVGGLILIVLANTLFLHLHEMGAPSNVPTSFLSALFNTLGIVVLAKALCGFFAGWGLMQREPWGRVVSSPAPRRRAWFPPAGPRSSASRCPGRNRASRAGA